MRKTMKGMLLAGLAMLWATNAYAQFGGSEGQLSSFLAQSANWLVTVLGPGVFVLGLIMVGVSMSMGNEDAMRRGGFVIGGGVLIFLSQAFVSLLRRLASGV